MKSAIIIAAIMMALGAGVGVQSWRLHNARQLTEQQAQTLSLQQTALDEKSSQLKTLSEQAERNNLEQARLRDMAAETQAALSERQKVVMRLQHENEALKRWADTDLPADIIRLRQHPAFTGGRAYREWLSQANALPLPSGQSANQR
ncbi:Rz-like lysis system protein LysB [Dickeya undicola]|uniref:LysB family phage lysis regulatory protein n=1 Tax=Dickeya undicola TaxID=1577887 RepID=A0A3N0G6G2_9GAMM|nr:Rz-like lysis system protein LysB [Dickeya undicola]RNM07688.1 LysB family phage lysis regulatory protein [Dickeya undicola]RNM26722.1 LysB family phage lysis regulatory protein [Dickeya undicola]